MDFFRGYCKPLVFVAVGAALLIWSCHEWRQTEALIENGITATGEVVLIRAEDGQTAADRNYRPVVLFTTRDGRKVRYESIVSSYPPRYSEGARVRVYYHPGRPERARIDDFTDLWLRSIVLGGVGLLINVFGLASLHSLYKYGRKQINRGYPYPGRLE